MQHLQHADAVPGKFRLLAGLAGLGVGHLAQMHEGGGRQGKDEGGEGHFRQGALAAAAALVLTHAVLLLMRSGGRPAAPKAVRPPQRPLL